MDSSVKMRFVNPQVAVSIYDIYIPDDFGTYVNRKNVDEVLDKLFSDNVLQDTSTYISKVPVLMYHSVGNTSNNVLAVSKNTFENQIIAIKNAH